MPKMFSPSTYNVFKIIFLPMKTSKVAEPAQIQPKSQFLFHKNLPPQDFSIMTLYTSLAKFCCSFWPLYDIVIMTKQWLDGIFFDRLAFEGHFIFTRGGRKVLTLINGIGSALQLHAGPLEGLKIRWGHCTMYWNRVLCGRFLGIWL